MRTIKEIKQTPIDSWTPEDFEILEEAGIINWVGNNILPSWLRWILTQLCYYLDFKIHDANYWLIEDLPYKHREIERKKADFGLLKYSWLSPIYYIEKFSLTGLVIKDIGNIILTVIMFIFSLIACVVAIFAYILVRFWGKKSFKNNK